ncbi:MAG: hypothetical protein JW774_11385 [Candidatus Aureabacteria bacterium]|nr:hypothetical protein [Candidatus Auribacterota bacterium]
MLKILQHALRRMDSFLNEARPDFIVNHAPVTFVDYLYYLCARYKNTPFLNIRSMKIKNCVRVSTSFFGLPPQIAGRYAEYRKGTESPETDPALREARRVC